MGSRLDAVTEALRRLIEHGLPWFDEEQEAAKDARVARLEQAVERKRQRYIADRVRAEHVIDDYRRYDRVMRR